MVRMVAKAFEVVSSKGGLSAVRRGGLRERFPSFTYLEQPAVLTEQLAAAFFVGSQSTIPLAGRTHKSEELTDVYRRRPTIFPHVQWLIGWQFIGWNGISWHEQEGDIFRETC